MWNKQTCVESQVFGTSSSFIHTALVSQILLNVFSFYNFVKHKVSLSLFVESIYIWLEVSRSSCAGEVRHKGIARATQQLLWYKFHDFLAIFAPAHSKINQIQVFSIACRKSWDPTLNAVLLFCWEDTGSKIQFSLVSIYKKMGLTTSKSWFGWKHGL